MTALIVTEPVVGATVSEVVTMVEFPSDISAYGVIESLVDCSISRGSVVDSVVWPKLNAVVLTDEVGLELAVGSAVAGFWVVFSDPIVVDSNCSTLLLVISIEVLDGFSVVESVDSVLVDSKPFGSVDSMVVVLSVLPVLKLAVELGFVVSDAVRLEVVEMSTFVLWIGLFVITVLVVLSSCKVLPEKLVLSKTALGSRVNARKIMSKQCNNFY